MACWTFLSSRFDSQGFPIATWWRQCHLASGLVHPGGGSTYLYPYLSDWGYNPLTGMSHQVCIYKYVLIYIYIHTYIINHLHL